MFFKKQYNLKFIQVIIMSCVFIFVYFFILSGAALAASESTSPKFCCFCKRTLLGCKQQLPITISAVDLNAASGSCNTSCRDSGAGTSVSALQCGEVIEGRCESGGTVVSFGANPLCPTGVPCDLPSIIGRLIRVILGIVGSIALVMFVYGGFIWMTGASRGEKKVQYAKDILIWSTLGLFVIFTSYIIVDYIIRNLPTNP